MTIKDGAFYVCVHETTIEKFEEKANQLVSKGLVPHGEIQAHNGFLQGFYRPMSDDPMLRVSVPAEDEEPESVPLGPSQTEHAIVFRILKFMSKDVFLMKLLVDNGSGSPVAITVDEDEFKVATRGLPYSTVVRGDELCRAINLCVENNVLFMMKVSPDGDGWCGLQVVGHA